MKKEILYHGSPVIVDNPEYGKGNIYNDYGRGFYCTNHIELAKEWAVGKNVDGYLNKYEIDLEGLKILDLLDEIHHILHWLALLLKYRRFETKQPVAATGKEYILDHYLIDTSEFDLIVGYRADDSYFQFAKDFLNNTISLKQLENAMKLGDLKEQYVLISPKAFERIKYTSSEIVMKDGYYDKRFQRDQNARAKYMESLKEIDANGIFMRDIINGVDIHG